MEHNEIQILFYGDKISEFFPKLRNVNSSEVFISKITRTENQNYLFVDLTIEKNIKPQTLKIDFQFVLDAHDEIWSRTKPGKIAK